MEQSAFEVPDWNPGNIVKVNGTLGVPVAKKETNGTGGLVFPEFDLELRTPPQPSPKVREEEKDIEDTENAKGKEFRVRVGYPGGFTGCGDSTTTTINPKLKDDKDTGDDKLKERMVNEPDFFQIDKEVTNKFKSKLVSQALLGANNGFGVKSEQQSVDEINSKIEDEIEVVKPEYVDPRFVSNISKKPMYRLQQGKFRHYFTFTDPTQVQGMQGQVLTPKDYVKFYPSVTTIIGYRQPESEFLLEMISKMGLVEFRKWFGLTAKYGTLDHILSLEHLASGVTADKRYLNFDLIPQRVEEYIAKHKLDVNQYKWVEKIQQDMLAFRQFYIDYNVVPLAIEALGYWDNGIHRFGGALDIICEMDYTEKGFFGEIYKSGAQKGQPKESKQTKRITAIIDLKSGRNGFREEHREQLVMYDMIAEKCFGIKVDRLYNVAPKDWTTEPGYHLKDQTDGRTLGKIPHLLGLFFDDYKGPKDIKIISGSLTGIQDYSDVCRKVNAHDFIFNKMYNKQNR